MIYENVFNCDVPNFKMYKDLIQKGLYVLPDRNLKENLIITLLERNHETEIYTGRYLNLIIIDISADHKNELLANLWYLNCKIVDVGHSAFLNGKIKDVLNHRKINKSEIQKFHYEEWAKDQTTKTPTTSKSKNQTNSKTNKQKRPQHEN